MDIRIWNKETKQAYVGTMLYSILGIVAAILTPIAAIGAIASLTGAASGGGVVGVLLIITEIAIIFGYVIFFLAIKDLKKITEGEVQKAFNKIYLSIIFDILGAIFSILHIGIISGLLAIASCILLLLAYSSLKKSSVIAEISSNAADGFSRLFTAEVLSIIGAVIALIPVLGFVGSILKLIAWIMILLGWKKIAIPVEIPGEAPEAEKGMFETIKEVVSDSIVEAKDTAKDIAKDISAKSEIVIDEVSAKAKEAGESIKERIKDAEKAEEAPAQPEAVEAPEVKEEAE